MLRVSAIDSQRMLIRVEMGVVLKSRLRRGGRKDRHATLSRYTHRVAISNSRRLGSDLKPRVPPKYSAVYSPDGRVKKIRIFEARAETELSDAFTHRTKQEQSPNQFGSNR